MARGALRGPRGRSRRLPAQDPPQRDRRPGRHPARRPAAQPPTRALAGEGGARRPARRGDPMRLADVLGAQARHATLRGAAGCGRRRAGPPRSVHLVRHHGRGPAGRGLRRLAASACSRRRRPSRRRCSLTAACRGTSTRSRCRSTISSARARPPAARSTTPTSPRCSAACAATTRSSAADRRAADGDADQPAQRRPSDGRQPLRRRALRRRRSASSDPAERIRIVHEFVLERSRGARDRRARVRSRRR